MRLWVNPVALFLELGFGCCLGILQFFCLYLFTDRLRYFDGRKGSTGLIGYEDGSDNDNKKHVSSEPRYNLSSDRYKKVLIAQNGYSPSKKEWSLFTNIST